MCLSEVIKKSELSKNALINYKNRIGYKVFYCRNDKLDFEFYNLLGKFGLYDNIIIKNKWYRSTDTIIKVDYNEEYKSGFHIFLNEYEAVYWNDAIYKKIIKVKFKNISCFGLQNDLEVVVAKEMLIMKD